MAQTKIEQGLLKFTEATDYLKIPTGTTAQRPSSPSAGYIRFNTTISAVETYDGTKWVEIGLNPPTFSSVDYPGSATALDPAGGESLVINGDTFNVGITVTIGGTTPSSITRNSLTQLTVITPAKTAGTYDIVLTNTDGGTATATNAVSYNGIPAFTNAAGSLGSVNEGEAINFSVAATEPDGGTITYAVTSGALPSGASLNTTTGAITGTAPSVSADTTSNFTITATDNENQTASRAYSITITAVLPSGNFNTVLYTGNGSTQSITGVGFQPDLVWIKGRSVSYSHWFYDSNRGINKGLNSNSTGAENTTTGLFSSFDSDGFTLGSNGEVNQSSATYVAWCWKANGGTTSSNTDGTITSTVQANQNLGFSIATYTGTGATASVGHGLGVKPDLVIIKHTNDASAWVTFSDATGTFSYSYLNTTDAFTAYPAMSWDSSVLNLNSGGDQNGASDTHIAYFFTSKEGFSKIGSYTGNGSTNGPIVNLGFEPAFLMIKRTDTAGYGWTVWDNKRIPAGQKTLYAYLTNAESNFGYINFLSNGFQHTRTNASINASGGTYMYIAFAADPDTTAPTLADSFNTLTYTGDGTNGKGITGLGFQPNLVWIKPRSFADNHAIADSIRGIGKTIASNSTAAENSLGLASFDSDGFTLADPNWNNINQSGQNFVAWAWKANDALPTINTDGSVDTIVSANANAGFSIVKIGTGGPNTYGHGLSQAPEFIFTKILTVTSDWYVYNKDFNGGTNPANYFMKLNTGDAETLNSSGSIWNSTAPTSTVFSLGTSIGNAIAYCFHSVSGFSKIGTYTGTGISGNAQNIGFQPDYVMIKSRGIYNWNIYDVKRPSGSITGRYMLLANGADTEFTSSVVHIDLTSTGFSFPNGYDGTNKSGQPYIYMAFKIN